VFSVINAGIKKVQEAKERSNPPLNKSDWCMLFSEWKISRLSQKQFCDERKINFHTFSYWRSKLNREKKPTASFQAVHVTPMTPEPRPVETALIELGLPNGITLSIPPTADKILLKMLFTLLGIKSC
jgi:hypothetical protein